MVAWRGWCSVLQPLTNMDQGCMPGEGGRKDSDMTPKKRVFVAYYPPWCSVVPPFCSVVPPAVVAAKGEEEAFTRMCSRTYLRE